MVNWWQSHWWPRLINMGSKNWLLILIGIVILLADLLTCWYQWSSFITISGLFWHNKANPKLGRWSRCYVWLVQSERCALNLHRLIDIVVKIVLPFFWMVLLVKLVGCSHWTLTLNISLILQYHKEWFYSTTISSFDSFGATITQDIWTWFWTNIKVSKDCL